jgi:hypothetical protein
MRVIGYLYNTLKDNFATMQPGDFNELSGQINRLLQDSSELLRLQPEPQSESYRRFSIFNPRPQSEPEPQPQPEPEPEPQPQPQPESYRRFSIFQSRNDNSEMDIQHRPFQTPPPAQQSDVPPPIVRNHSQSNITMTRGGHRFQDDEPMSLIELDDDSDSDDDSSNFMDETGEEYQVYASYKVKPRLTTKCHSKKDAREKTTDCGICFEKYDLHQTLTFGCGHELCKECVCDHFHHSVENQPYKRFYSCPFCRADVKKVRVNYSKINAKNKEELMTTSLVTQMKTWCY